MWMVDWEVGNQKPEIRSQIKLQTCHPSSGQLEFYNILFLLALTPGTWHLTPDTFLQASASEAYS
jgi:hypothetical protein